MVYYIDEMSYKPPDQEEDLYKGSSTHAGCTCELKEADSGCGRTREVGERLYKRIQKT